MCILFLFMFYLKIKAETTPQGNSRSCMVVVVPAGVDNLSFQFFSPSTVRSVPGRMED